MSRCDLFTSRALSHVGLDYVQHDVAIRPNAIRCLLIFPAYLSCSVPPPSFPGLNPTRRPSMLVQSIDTFPLVFRPTHCFDVGSASRTSTRHRWMPQQSFACARYKTAAAPSGCCRCKQARQRARVAMFFLRSCTARRSFDGRVFLLLCHKLFALRRRLFLLSESVYLPMSRCAFAHACARAYCIMCRYSYFSVNWSDGDSSSVVRAGFSCDGVACLDHWIPGSLDSGYRMMGALLPAWVLYCQPDCLAACPLAHTYGPLVRPHINWMPARSSACLSARPSARPPAHPHVRPPAARPPHLHFHYTILGSCRTD